MPLDLSALGFTPDMAKALAPQQPTGLMDRASAVLSNPMLQAALAGYLGFAGTPRREGEGTALSRGGLGALGAFNTARQTQLLQPLMQAKTAGAYAQIPRDIAQTKSLGATTELHEKQAGSYVKDDQLADQYMTLAQNEADPHKKTIYSLLSTGFRNGMQVDKAMNAAIKGDTSALQMEVLGQRAELLKTQNQYAPQLAQSKLAEQGAQTQRAEAGTAEAIAGTQLKGAQLQEEPLKATKLKADTELTREKITAAPFAKIDNDTKTFAAIDKPPIATDYRPDAAQRWIQNATAYSVSLGNDPNIAKQRAEALLNALQPGAVSGGATMAGSTPAPAGATAEILGPDGTVHGHIGPDGKPIWLPGKEPNVSAKR